MHHVFFTHFQRMASAYHIGKVTHWVAMAAFVWKSCFRLGMKDAIQNGCLGDKKAQLKAFCIKNNTGFEE